MVSVMVSVKTTSTLSGEYVIGQAYNKGNLVVLSKEDAKDESPLEREDEGYIKSSRALEIGYYDNPFESCSTIKSLFRYKE